jgi:tetratricopeptide (TPR) repeat protein
MTDAPNADIYTIWLTQLKWAFKDRREGISYFKQLTQKLVFWYGDHNPMLNRVYQLYAEEYIAAHEYEDALIVAKNELVNSLKVFGNSNPNTAQAYVHTGQILVRLSKRDDALNYYLKACQVFESKGRKASIEWASIASRAALLMLSFGRLEESATMCKLCCRVFSERGK